MIDRTPGGEYTTKETREQFLQHIANMVGYWERETRAPSSKEKLEGLTHSILCMLDGCSGGMPGFVILPICTEDDREYLQEEGGRWHPVIDFTEVEKYDVGGSLHEELHHYFKE